MSKDRRTKEYDDGVEAFLNYAFENKKNKKCKVISCPCEDCLNFRSFPVDVVREHLFFKGIDQNYIRWTRHGENFESTSSASVDVRDSMFNEFDMGHADDIPETIEMVQVAQEDFSGDPSKLQKLLKDAEKPLFPGCCKHTKLEALVKLYNLKAKHGVSDKFFTELLVLLKDMLPTDNELPCSTYEAKKSLNALGMEYVKIHACPNDCILYRKEHENAIVCPTCGKSRWKEDKEMLKVSEGVPAKVLWYFPIIPRLKRFFLSKETAKNLTWHDRERKKDGVLRHPADSQAWKAVDERYPEFVEDPRNLRLGISADGINPHSSQSSRYSCWPVLTVIYNLPPWLCMKRKFMMLTMLISGPKQPGNDIDVYLAPFIDDLKLLFEVGVKAYDAYKEEKFMLRVVVLWTINDYPALSILCGCTVKGYHACSVCGKNIQSTWLSHSKKIAYTGHRKWLPSNHAFRRQRKAFDGNQEFGVAPEPFSGLQIFEEVQFIENSWGKIKKNDRTLGKSKRSNVEVVNRWKKMSIWVKELRYWKYHLVQHNLDVMHIEKNVCESIVGTLLNIPGKSKDGYNARKDLEKLRLRNELAPQNVGKRMYLPPACYTLTKEEKKKLCTTLFELKVPDEYCSNFSNLVSLKELKLFGLKSHDYHMLMQQFLPLAIRSIMPQHVRHTIIRLCFFFNAICNKEVNIDQLSTIQKDLVETLCLFEKYFPPSFFDIMIHLTVHLVREVQLCGPVYFRWMYPFERFMKVLKGYV